METARRTPPLFEELNREIHLAMQAVEDRSMALGNAARESVIRRPLLLLGLGLTTGAVLGSPLGRRLTGHLVATTGRVAFTAALGTLARDFATGALRSDLDLEV